MIRDFLAAYWPVVLLAWSIAAVMVGVTFGAMARAGMADNDDEPECWPLTDEGRQMDELRQRRNNHGGEAA
jgi:hypothetical protein